MDPVGLHKFLMYIVALILILMAFTSLAYEFTDGKENRAANNRPAQIRFAKKWLDGIGMFIAALVLIYMTWFTDLNIRANNGGGNGGGYGSVYP